VSSKYHINKKVLQRSRVFNLKKNVKNKNLTTFKNKNLLLKRKNVSCVSLKKHKILKNDEKKRIKRNLIKKGKVLKGEERVLKLKKKYLKHKKKNRVRAIRKQIIAKKRTNIIFRFTNFFSRNIKSADFYFNA
jgi:hypothetical protein